MRFARSTANVSDGGDDNGRSGASDADARRQRSAEFYSQLPRPVQAPFLTGPTIVVDGGSSLMNPDFPLALQVRK
jgi:hypothetical protein